MAVSIAVISPPPSAGRVWIGDSELELGTGLGFGFAVEGPLKVELCGGRCILRDVDSPAELFRALDSKSQNCYEYLQKS